MNINKTAPTNKEACNTQNYASTAVTKYLGVYECQSGEEAHFEIYKNNNELSAGSFVNTGFVVNYTWELNGPSLDTDLSDFIDYIEECERMQI